MDREAEVQVLSIALLMVQDVGTKERDPNALDTPVPLRTFDALADIFRDNGVDLGGAHNVGRDAAQRKQEQRYAHCRVCGLSLEEGKGELFVGKDGEVYCNDHWPEKEEWQL
jgi:hypothetical protein